METFESKGREEGRYTVPPLSGGEAVIETDSEARVASMGRDSISRLLLRFSLPATIAMAVMASYNIIDTIFVGRLGSEAIAALSVSFPIQMIIGALGVGTGVGASSLISRSLGAGNREDAAVAAGQVFFLALVLGVAVTVPGLLFLRPLLLLFGATPGILEMTTQYMAVIIAGTIFLMIMMMLNNVTRSEGNALLSMRVMIISSVANVIMDPIFIFTLGMGVRGAAVATLLAKVIGAGLLLHYYVGRRSALSLRPAHLKPRLPVILEIYRVGVPTMIIQMAGNFSLVLVNRFLGGFGHIPIAVMGLIVRFQMFAFMPVVGISQGLLPIIGFNYGAKKPLRIRESLIKGIGVGAIFTSAIGAAFFAFPNFFLRLFSTDPELLTVGAGAVRIMVVMYPLLAPVIITVSFFQAVGKGTPTLVLSLLRQFLIYIPCIMILPRFFGLTGIWVSTPLADSLTFIIVSIFLASELRRQNIPCLKAKCSRPQR
ncbi:MAG: MATE family efflux transporter [Bacillota bacterium]